ncbi:MAG: NAD-dependent epimerase/dehydratase family protein [Proteobacteria bacterium]|nr:NAD-dependent epimerase/dehydratase family protein [Pseudomonadota bacterium]
MNYDAPILITGTAGFIGFHLTKHLLEQGHHVVGLDNMNPYYDIRLKEDRLSQLSHPHFQFQPCDLAYKDAVMGLFSNFKPKIVIHLAAQAGVRYSIDNPSAYMDSNMIGFFNILEAARHHNINHLIYASSSSVYGASTDYPFSEKQAVNHPVSFYAATKKANEAMAHSYAHLYGLPCTGLRFFTVYGPWGRPDMAYWRFTDRIMKGEPIQVFGEGKMSRDFTYIDDIIDGIIRLIPLPPQPNPNWDSKTQDQATSMAPWRILNIGNNQPTELEHFISVLEETIGIKAVKEYLPMQDGDVRSTAADITAIQELTGFQPRTKIEDGIPAFVEWYRRWHGNKG